MPIFGVNRTNQTYYASFGSRTLVHLVSLPVVTMYEANPDDFVSTITRTCQTDYPNDTCSCGHRIYWEQRAGYVGVDVRSSDTAVRMRRSEGIVDDPLEALLVNTEPETCKWCGCVHSEFVGRKRI